MIVIFIVNVFIIVIVNIIVIVSAVGYGVFAVVVVISMVVVNCGPICNVEIPYNQILNGYDVVANILQCGINVGVKKKKKFCLCLLYVEKKKKL